MSGKGVTVRVKLLGRYSSVIAVGDGDLSVQAPVEPESEVLEIPLEEKKSDNGGIWFYRAHPVVLPSQSTFAMALNFGEHKGIERGLPEGTRVRTLTREVDLPPPESSGHIFENPHDPDRSDGYWVHFDNGQEAFLEYAELERISGMEQLADVD